MPAELEITFQWLIELSKTDKPKGVERLFVGDVDKPVATIVASNSGKSWQIFCLLPGTQVSVLKRHDHVTAKQVAEQTVAEWLSKACATVQLGDQQVAMKEQTNA